MTISFVPTYRRCVLSCPHRGYTARLLYIVFFSFFHNTISLIFCSLTREAVLPGGRNHIYVWPLLLRLFSINRKYSSWKNITLQYKKGCGSIPDSIPFAFAVALTSAILICP